MSESRRDQQVLAIRLRAWAVERDLHIRVAVGLFAGHGALRRRAMCAGRHSRDVRIGCGDAAGRYAGSRLGGSPGELAILDLPVAAGGNRHRSWIAGPDGARAIAAAMARDAEADM